MANRVGWRKGALSVLFWSVIAAAFIGPGTVATAAGAGARFGYGLIWALVFSILATAVLQEAAARLTLASGKNLGDIIALGAKGKAGAWIRWGLFFGVAFGCAAFQAGNLLGALAGLAFFGAGPKALFTILVSLAAAGLLWVGRYRVIANALAVIVAAMGLAFVFVAYAAGSVDVGAMAGGLRPRLPEGAGLFVLGLIGTTIVPYNLFLASGISRDQSIVEMRVGVWSAVFIGGLISLAVLLVGTTVSGSFDFERLAAALSTQLGDWAVHFLGLGLFAAGFTSSITAPLAAAVTGRALVGRHWPGWSGRGKHFRLTWAAILGVGTLFGLLDLQPIPVIIMAQALNGLLLPVVALFLFVAINRVDLLGAGQANGPVGNGIMLAIVGVACFLGLVNLWKVALRIWPALDGEAALPVIALLTLLIVGSVARTVWGAPKK